MAARWFETLTRLQGVEISSEGRSRIDAEAERFEQRWLQYRTAERLDGCALTDAQRFVAHEHGFASWPRFAKHVEGLARVSSPISHFEAAVEAIVSGDIVTLEKMLQEQPDLVRQRSTREHRSTLLHYVSANGVEDFRQKTPGDIVAIASLLLEAGADVDAESDAMAVDPRRSG